MSTDAAAAIKAEEDAAIARGDHVEAPGAETEEEKAAKVAEEEAAKKAAEDADKDLETEEEKAEREKGEAAHAEKLEREKRIRIPKARFDEAQAKARAREQALLQQLDELKKQGTSKQEVDDLGKMKAKIDELDDRYEELLLDGKKDDARKIRIERAALQEQLADHKTSRMSAAATQQAIDQVTYDSQLSRFEQVYPELNPDSEEFSQDAAESVAALMTKLMKAGDPRAEALAQAVRYTLGTPRERQSVENDEVSKARAARELAAKQKAVDALRRAAPDKSKLGLDSDKAGGKPGDQGKIDVMRLKQSSFDKLTDEEKAKLRGDEI